MKRTLIPTPPSTPACKGCGCGSLVASESHSRLSECKKYIPALLSLCLLMGGILSDQGVKTDLFTGPVRFIWYLVAYLPVALPVLREAGAMILRKDFFNEFVLMTVATLGAFFIGEYPEGVAVMLFYSVGELFQGSAVSKAQGHIKALLDIRPQVATVRRNNQYEQVLPEAVAVGEILQVKAGEKVPLDGRLLSRSGSFNTSALTGESIPRTFRRGETVLAGMLNQNQVIELQVEKVYADTSLSKILEMVQHAVSRKAPTELLIRKFARVYTPVVFLLAFCLTVLPYFVVTDYKLADWLYRALVFLVISCPCALVVSIPLSYFGGIGAASRQGILFKGANYLEQITHVNTVVMDKTGTLTEGVFQVKEAVPATPDSLQWMEYAALLERHSTHPVAKAITDYYSHKELPPYSPVEVKELPGKGMQGTINGHKMRVGNPKLLREHGISVPELIDTIKDTVVVVGVDGKYAGFFIVADRVKKDAALAIRQLRKEGIRHLIMLSGDTDAIVKEVAGELLMDEAYGNLLPEDKVRHVERLKTDPSRTLAFVGDGINDAPVLAISDIGIAMGGMGTDVAIEIADVVLQTDQPSKLATALRIARSTRHIVIQNIVFALGIKLGILLLGALGHATMWEAVFADVGVSLLAILNAIRILKKKF